MEKLNVNDWAKKIIAQSNRIAIPILTNPGIEMIGKTVHEAVTNGEIHFRAVEELAKAYPSAATAVVMDLTVEAEAFGAEVNFYENEVPSVAKRLVSDFESVQNLQVPSLQTGRVQEYIKANKLAAENINDRPVLSGCIGPFSLAGRLFDMTEIMTAIYTEPETIDLLLEKCTQFIIDYCGALKATGVDGVVVAEPAAGLLGNDECMDYSSKYVIKIVEALQDENFGIILHNCGNKGQCTPAVLATKSFAYHFGNAMDMVKALEDCPSDVLIMGNIDPVGVLKVASPSDVKRITLELLEKTASYPNFVLSTGCDVPPLVPKENIDAFFEALNQFNI